MTELERKVLNALPVGEVADKASIMARVYQGQPEPRMKILDIVVCRLRKQGADIETVWGRGYKLRAPMHERQPQ
jgi:DNA-binding response OmpR family regulator